jgi:S-methylmethionine-dependent homocysteine/selenocysteine methylase
VTGSVWADRGVLRLDGATATELQRRGISVRAPWWTTAALTSARGRATLGAIHADHVRAGADIVTANTFRCNRRALVRAGVDRAAHAPMVRAAIGIAREAAAGARPERPVWIAGSMAPVEDCYRPDLAPGSGDLRAEHAWLARALVSAGVDLVLVETMGCVREARIALESVQAAGGRAVVSFVAGDGGRLLSGEPVGPAARAVERDGATAVLVNCTTIGRTEVCLRQMRELTDGPLGAYPNVEDRSGVPPLSPVDGALPVGVGPAAFAGTAARWCADVGLRLVGGCCGTTPDHLAAMCRLLPRPPALRGVVQRPADRDDRAVG